MAKYARWDRGFSGKIVTVRTSRPREYLTEREIERLI
jgi:hypothetical protein